MASASSSPAVNPRLQAELSIGRLARLRRWTHDGAPTVAARPSAHPAVEIAWVDAGGLTYQIGTRTLDASAGSVVVIPRDAEHTTTFGGSVRAAALWVGTEMVDEIGDALGRRGAARALAPGRLAGGAEIPSLARLLSAELAAGEPGALVAAEALLEAIVVRTLRVAPLGPRASGASSPRIAAAVDFVRTHYAQPLGVDDLARQAGMSRFHFSRQFRGEVGVSPYRFLLRVRVERAAELLRGGRHDVTQAALEVGFGDLGRFARAFRARFGHSPSQARGRMASAAAA